MAPIEDSPGIGHMHTSHIVTTLMEQERALQHYQQIGVTVVCARALLSEAVSNGIFIHNISQ